MTNQLAVLTVLGFAGLAGTPAAATLCVDPTGAAGCRTTIQAAVDAAGGGDLILVAPGVYFESVVVPSGKDGLRIVGTRRDTTIVDASPYSDRGITGDDPAFLVQSSSVVLRALTVRNGSTGVQIEGPRSGARHARVPRRRPGGRDPGPPCGSPRQHLPRLPGVRIHPGVGRRRARQHVQRRHHQRRTRRVHGRPPAGRLPATGDYPAVGAGYSSRPTTPRRVRTTSVIN